MTPNAAAAESRFITAAVGGDDEAAEHRHQQQERQQHDDADEQRQLAREHAREVGEDRRLAADQDVHAAAGARRRDDGVAQGA